MASQNLTWSSIKTLASLLYGQYIGSGKLIDGESGNPSALSLILDLINQQITGYPFEFDFLKVKTTLTLTGATSYDLTQLFPDYASTFQIFGILQNQESRPLADYDANIIPYNNGYTVANGILTLTGNVPTGGTCGIQYKSLFIVQDINGTRKRYFSDATDTTVLTAQFDAFLIHGIGQYVDWLSDSKAQEQRTKMDNWAKGDWNNLLLFNPITSQVHSML